MPGIEQRYRLLYKPLVFAAALLPLAWVCAGAFGIAGADLGPEPIEKIVHTFGKTALNFLVLVLLVTPVCRIFRQPHLFRLRRMLGLFAFFYASLHFLAYVGLDQQLDFRALSEDVLERPYIALGFTALLILIPLAVTSTDGMMRRLGRHWSRLHRLVYAAAALAAWHYFAQVKADVREPLIYAAALALLLGYRIVRSRRGRSVLRRLQSA